MENQSFNSNTNYDSRGNKRTGTIFIIATVLLFGICAYLTVANVHKANESKQLSEAVAASDARYTDLDSKYSATLAEIDSYKGKNAELDSVLSVKEKYILDLKANLSKQKKQFTISEADYKAQLANFNTMVASLNSQLDSLQKVNQTLVAQNDTLGHHLSDAMSQNSTLTSTNTMLTQKVTIASLLKPENIVASADYIKSSGKEVETSKAKKAQELKVCFDVPENKIADPGAKTMLVRIVTPEGVPLAVQDKGSGVFTSTENGQEQQYTTSTTLNYDQQRQSVCTKWNQNMAFQPGTYTAEIYQDGYLVGKKEFALK